MPVSALLLSQCFSKAREIKKSRQRAQRRRNLPLCLFADAIGGNNYNRNNLPPILVGLKALLLLHLSLQLDLKYTQAKLAMSKVVIVTGIDILPLITFALIITSFFSKAPHLELASKPQLSLLQRDGRLMLPFAPCPRRTT